MNELLEALQPALLSIAVTILTALASWLGIKAKEFFNTIEKRKMVEATVRYVDQVADTLINEEKKALAKEKVLEWAKDKKLVMSDVEIDILIESFVNEFRKEYNKPQKVGVEVNE